jgi:tetratricopeptide (TPR) repeat protein
MKKIVLVLIILTSIIIFKFVYTYAVNSIIISDYEKGKYNQGLGKALHFLNFPDSYIAYYNNGNLYYKNGDYESAVDSYKEALSLPHPLNRKDCKIRINLVLAMLKTFNLDNLDKQKVESILKILSEAKGILTENNCAGKTSPDGHSKEAEELKKEIEELEEMLKQQSDKEESEEENEDDKQEEKDNSDSGDIEKKLMELQEVANDAREKNKDNRLYEYVGSYDGKKW